MSWHVKFFSQGIIDFEQIGKRHEDRMGCELHMDKYKSFVV